jgi:ATPase subunit of ABC transporter with duplicated ATPase domains
MTVLEARGIGVAWTASMPILKDVSFVLTKGWYGLVGANGAGKTTLLRVLAGELAPHEGSIRFDSNEASIAYCPQSVDEPNADVLALAASFDGMSAEIKGRLGLDEGELDRWPTLSPGERKRWQIGAALAREPDILLLDEPTNHLDGAARDRLMGALGRFRGIGVVVSHDRSVIERLPRAILRVFDGTVTLHPGAYSGAKSAWEDARRGQEEAHTRAKATVRATERRLDAARRTSESASHSVSSRTRMKDKNDHDGRDFGQKNLVRWAAAKAGRQVEIVRRELDRARADVPKIERDRTVGGAVFATYERAPNAVLFHLDVPEIRAGDRVVLEDMRLTIGRADRVRIAGPNGAGKTTLLRALMASRQSTSRLLYLPQELEPQRVVELTERLATLDDEERGRVLSVFSALGSDPARLLGRGAASTLSPGEARKLALAMGLGQHAWALVLDEPTNHLDLPTIERLEQALSGYPGCIILVTHDDAFASAVTISTIEL